MSAAQGADILPKVELLTFKQKQERKQYMLKLLKHLVI
ncbi:hypothetical protein GXM_00967 [Nostoc sphaeroides CCNUC1]|uniref:Uncharacterized protein n=1 Tax=Nostoc sphaeroides CCNUC1 TaxID=2653204 RepID=A0A5P8VT40_9NOSO|nr:hypothetical protein GXM_00967 [Nostoc sphaeroides CCNUC1]